MLNSIAVLILLYASFPDFLSFYRSVENIFTVINFFLKNLMHPISIRYRGDILLIGRTASVDKFGVNV